jgi:hypothetical protein
LPIELALLALDDELGGLLRVDARLAHDRATRDMPWNGTIRVCIKPSAAGRDPCLLREQRVGLA